MIRIASAMLIMALLSGSSVYAQAKTDEKGNNLNGNEDALTNRSVLILDFANLQKNEGTSYLGISTPEAMIDPLKGTRKFEILPRDKADAIMLKLGIDKNSAITETQASEIGKAVGADVVVLGSFTTAGNTVQLRAKAIEVNTGRIAVAKSKSGPLDATIFNLIGDLSNEMSADMAKEMPPISQKERVVVRGFSGRLIYDFRLHAALTTGLPQLIPGEYLKPVFGGRIDGSFSFAVPWLQPYAEASYSVATGQKRVTDMNLAHFGAGLTYTFQFSGWGFIKEIMIAPYFAGGFYAGKVNLLYGYVSDSVAYMVGSIDTGVNFDFYISRHVAISTNISGGYLFDAETPLILTAISIGAGYRF